MLLFAAASAQTVSVTFTGRDAQNHYLPLNRVVVSNHTKGWQETLVWPDTVLVMTATECGDVSGNVSTFIAEQSQSVRRNHIREPECDRAGRCGIGVNRHRRTYCRGE